ncbi:hypothetical protein JCM5350_005060 [Sporobolomyces pararoseus]
MSNQEPTQAATDLNQGEDDYENVLKNFTQSFEEDNIETEQLRSIPLDTTSHAAPKAPTQQRFEQAPDPVDVSPENLRTGRRRSNSPAPSSSSSSGLTYASLDPATEAQIETHQAQRQSVASQAGAAFIPILPEELTASRFPSPSSSRAPRPSTNSIPSPFLAATDYPRPSRVPVRSGGAAAGPDVSPFRDLQRRQRSDSLEPPRLDLSSPFEKLPTWVERDGQASDRGYQAKGEGKERIEIEVDEWTRKFLEADRKLKAAQIQARDSKRKSQDLQSDVEEEHDQGSGNFDGNDDDEGVLPDPSQVGRNQSPAIFSPFASSPSEQQDSAPSTSKSKSKSKRDKVSRKQKRKNRTSDDLSREEQDDPSENGFSSDRNMTTEKSVAMLPKWRPGRAVRKKRRGNFGLYSEIEEAEEEEEEDESPPEDEEDIEEEQEEEEEGEEETDYDEPASSAHTKSKTYQSRKRAKPSNVTRKTKSKPRKQVVDSPEMILGDRTNLSKWREIDAYELETELTL